jgi:hypothetical protein
MSTAVLERVIEQPQSLEPKAVALVTLSPEAPATTWSDPHPLLPVFIAGAISLLLSGGFVGAILIWLATRHGGIMAP